ncbi:hypothetical protein P7B02_07850 [Caulobacter segnis]|uniref:hypothetical protein n=1 Tax=Caulobacter segnis TaxID=88688 RepID=UPI002410353E|nr:hypothetical protein [Caulobacter segnis]MDG2521452.1 hypothetical protein [Caulobacter segnis]
MSRLSGPVAAMFVGGLTSGALDITCAFLSWAPRGVTPARILKGIAAGLLGKGAMGGGIAMAALGLFLHFAIAMAAAVVFVLVATRVLPQLLERPLIWGPLFGLGMFGVMNAVVLPLNANPPQRPPEPAYVVLGLFVHAFAFGLPIGLAAWRFARQP